MILRRASAADVEALTDCLIAAYAPFQSLGLPPVAEGIADDIRDHHVWVAVLDDAIRGGIVLGLDQDAHIMNLAVHPDAGGQGIGKALIDQAITAAKLAGYDTMQLATHEGMTATQAFYAKLGWGETGRDGNKVYFRLELT